jgi:hypothetical protein
MIDDIVQYGAVWKGVTEYERNVMVVVWQQAWSSQQGSRTLGLLEGYFDTDRQDSGVVASQPRRCIRWLTLAIGLLFPP